MKQKVLIPIPVGEENELPPLAKNSTVFSVPVLVSVKNKFGTYPSVTGYDYEDGVWECLYEKESNEVTHWYKEVEGHFFSDEELADHVKEKIKEAIYEAFNPKTK